MDGDTTSRWHSLLMDSVGGSRRRALELGNPGLCCLRSFPFPRFLLYCPGSQKWEEAMGGLWHLPQLELHHRCLALTMVLWCVCLCVYVCTCMCIYTHQQYCLTFTFTFPDLENFKFLVYVDQFAISISYNCYSLVDVKWRILSRSVS